jgi:hypothetical protein
MFEPLDRFRNWLGERDRKRALDISFREIRKFLDGMKQLSDEDMGIVVAVAHVIRVEIEDKGALPPGLFGNATLPSTDELGKIQYEMNQLIRHFNRLKQPTDALAATVLSLSLRCLNVPELRGLGQEMWGEMSRGFPYAENVLKTGEKNRGEPLPARIWSEWNRIPAGLEPPGATPRPRADEPATKPAKRRRGFPADTPRKKRPNPWR